MRRRSRLVTWIALLVLTALVGVAILGGRRLALQMFFTFHGTTNPLPLLERQTSIATHAAYGHDSVQFGELRIPRASGLHPVAILIHGGCWSATVGVLPPSVTSYALLGPMAAALTERGIATWNVEYRRLGDAGGGWPGTYQDLAAAADFLRTLAPTYQLDLSRVIAVGHSSGGQLALWLAARRKLPRSSPLFAESPLAIQGVVDIDGPPDLEAATAVESEMCGDSVIERFVGGSPTVYPSRYRDGAATAFLPLGLRQELLYSERMEFMSGNEANWARLFLSWGTTATSAGDVLHLVALAGAGHFTALDPQTPAGRVVLATSDSLLAR